jgi:hypothetical protein
MIKNEPKLESGKRGDSPRRHGEHGEDNKEKTNCERPIKDRRKNEKIAKR